MTETQQGLTVDFALAIILPEPMRTVAWIDADRDRPRRLQCLADSNVLGVVENKANRSNLRK